MKKKTYSKYTFEKFRVNHPKAYEKWTTEDDGLLAEKFIMGVNLEELSGLLQRRKGAVSSRIKKLRLSGQARNQRAFDEIKIGFDFAISWQPVLSTPDNDYFFPNPVTDFMLKNYNKPVVYRWNIYKENTYSPKMFYIGMCGKLCPNRLGNYLHPRVSQGTSTRINKELSDFLRNGFVAQLEIACFDQLRISGLIVEMSDLRNKHIRLMVESLLIAYHELNGAKLLNL